MTEPLIVMADRAGRPEHTPEAEPVEIERDGDAVVFTLDDGETLRFRAEQLDAALHAGQAA